MVDTVAALVIPSRSGTDTYRQSPVCVRNVISVTNLSRINNIPHIQKADMLTRPGSRSSLRSSATKSDANGMRPCIPRPNKSRGLLGILAIDLLNESENSIYKNIIL